jgi:hypothetical protein
MANDSSINQKLMEHASKRVHLGDGAYAHFDGWNIWLTTLEGDRVALEHSTFDALVTYRAELKKKFVDAGAIPPGRGILG